MVTAWERQPASAGAGHTKLLLWIDRFDLRDLYGFGSMLPCEEHVFSKVVDYKTSYLGGEAASKLHQVIPARCSIHSMSGCPLVLAGSCAGSWVNWEPLPLLESAVRAATRTGIVCQFNCQFTE
jgi:hypothetical protein